MKLFIALALAATALTATPAHAVRISLVGAGNYSTPETTPSSDFNPKPAFGGGALLEFGIIPAIGIETGAIWVPRKYEVNNFGYGWTAEQTMVQVPLVLRARIGNVLSLGVGGYYAKYTGDIEYQNTRIAAVRPVQIPYGAAALSDDDYGVVTSLAFYSSFGPLARLVFDARYIIGMKDNDLFPGYEKKFKDVQLLLGLQIGI